MGETIPLVNYLLNFVALQRSYCRTNGNATWYIFEAISNRGHFTCVRICVTLIIDTILNFV